jgi:hypothetical protein
MFLIVVILNHVHLLMEMYVCGPSCPLQGHIFLTRDNSYLFRIEKHDIERPPPTGSRIVPLLAYNWGGDIDVVCAPLTYCLHENHVSILLDSL